MKKLIKINYYSQTFKTIYLKFRKMGKKKNTGMC